MSYLWFKVAAENDHVPAQYTLGLLYHEGNVIPQEYTKALTWFKRAVNRDIGHMYEKGLGLLEIIRKLWGSTLKHLAKVTMRQKKKIGQLLEYGFGVLQVNREALEYYKKLAEPSNRSEQLQLTITYLNGRANFDLDTVIQ